MRVEFASLIAVSQLFLGAYAENVHRWKGFCVDDAPLDAFSTDTAVQVLLKWAGSTGNTITSDDSNNQLHKESAFFVVAYACIDGNGDSATFTVDDIHAAFAAMDMNCAKYQPSYAIVEQKILGQWYTTTKVIGKASFWAPVCLGDRGGIEGPDTTPGGGIEW